MAPDYLPMLRIQRVWLSLIQSTGFEEPNPDIFQRKKALTGTEYRTEL